MTAIPIVTEYDSDITCELLTNLLTKKLTNKISLTKKRHNNRRIQTDWFEIH